MALREGCRQIKDIKRIGAEVKADFHVEGMVVLPRKKKQVYKLSFSRHKVVPKKTLGQVDRGGGGCASMSYVQPSHTLRIGCVGGHIVRKLILVL